MNLILKYVKPYWKRMTVGFGIKFIGTIADLFIPWILAYIIDDVVPMKNEEQIYLWGFLMVLCSVVALINNIIANRFATKVAKLASQKLRYDLFEKVSYLSCSQVDDLSIPSIISRLTSDTYTLHNYIGMIQRIGVRSPLLLIGGLVVMMILDFKLALVMILMLPFMAFLIYKISKKGIPLFTDSRISADKLVQSVRENVTGVRIIKALSKGDYEKGKFEKVNNEVIEKEEKAEGTMAGTSPIMNWFLNVGMAFVILVGAFLVNSGYSLPGKIIAFMSYFTIILNAVLGLTRIFVRSSKAIASANRLEEILSLQNDLNLLKEKDYKDNNCHLEFENVNFSYHKKETDLENISFKLKKGETLGIIGGTGCGKTTIINLIMRLYDVDSGAVRINGLNVKNIPQNELHKKFGVVFQNDILFEDTIKENINFGRIINDDDIEIVGEYSQAKEFINSLPDRYNHKLNIKGANVSGGQKQRILISRALAGNPEILILDDSSSALDYKTDSLLRQELVENFKDTTTIIIAQRISSIMNSEHIMVLDNGKILGYGTHNELMENCEMYREISNSQMGDTKNKAGEI